MPDVERRETETENRADSNVPDVENRETESRKREAASAEDAACALSSRCCGSTQSFQVTSPWHLCAVRTPMDEEVYVEPPRELVPDTSQVWRLQKALNGLRTASQKFQRYLYKILTLELGYKASRACPALLWHEQHDVRIAVHVDDPLVCGPIQHVNGLYKNLQKWLEVRQGDQFTDHDVTRYLGMNYVKSEGGYLEMPVEGYIGRITSLACVSGWKRVSSPGVKRTPPTEKSPESRLLDPSEHSIYRQVVGTSFRGGQTLCLPSNSVEDSWQDPECLIGRIYNG
eukprot:6452969-Amphidinium_carterae.2